MVFVVRTRWSMAVGRRFAVHCLYWNRTHLDQTVASINCDVLPAQLSRVTSFSAKNFMKAPQLSGKSASAVYL